MAELKDIREFKLGQSFKFQLSGSDGRYSTPYSVATQKSKDDVYITPMMMGGEMKLSLHKSGSWHAGLTPKGVAKFPNDDGPYWEIFRRPSEFGPGATRAWYLILPDDELRATSNDEAYKIPSVGPGYAASVEFLLLAEEGPTVEFGDVAFIGQWRLKVSGERLLLMSRRIPWTHEDRLRAKVAKAEAAAMAEAGGVQKSPEHAYFFHGHNEQGVRYGMELAAS